MGANASGWTADPFCGTGTTLVEAKFRGIPSLGVDSNPFSAMTSRAKVNWTIKPQKLLELATRVVEDSDVRGLENGLRTETPAPSIVKRGWVRESVWNEATTMLEQLRRPQSGRYAEVLRLALAWAVKQWASNIKFGPEAYRVVRRGPISVAKVFMKKVREMCMDLELIPRSIADVPAAVLHGDSRKADLLCESDRWADVKWVVTSPPYPTEHDYTRISRVELELLGLVRNGDELREIKQLMMRSNSKNIYAGDHDYDLVRRFVTIRRIVDRLEKRARRKEYGFARQYPKVVGEYFGGLYRHFASLARVLPRDAKCAYVLGEQCSYLGCFVPTAEITRRLLSSHELRFEDVHLIHLRTRRSTRGVRRRIREQAVIFQKR